MSEHSEHTAGTVSGCWHCTKIAYEPSWYASLVTFTTTEGRGGVRLDDGAIATT